MKDRAMFIYTNKELLDHLTELSNKLGRTPTRQEVEKRGPSAWVYYKRFGSYVNAVRMAGLKPNRLTRKEIEEEGR